jgi:hypothetical protein
MRRVRISTWVLTVVFLAALVAYLLVRPSSASIIHNPLGPARNAHSTSPAPLPPLPGSP